METNLTTQDLRNFELEIFDLFKNKKIFSPIHLRGGNEECLIDIFKNINKEDYCFLTWASHLECLLKGVPKEEVKNAILKNKSICLSFKEYNIISSAIVGGNGPIAVGVAMGIKQKGEKSHVWCFMGDMSFYTGTSQECIRYAEVHDLPITFVIADNKVSVTTPTREIWGNDIEKITKESKKCIRYEYTNVFPHAGIGEKVLF
jgi:TPP-dependent pyruvate/acetoin dehydrogenase alpha subunit